MTKKQKMILIGVIVAVLLIVIGFIVFVVIKVETTPIDTNTNIEGINENIENIEGANENTNEFIPVVTNQEITVEGRVFFKGYQTPSLSYGILTTEGQEIGFGAYNSMEEQFRPYVNEQVRVIFSDVCKSATGDCCRTLFFYCGTVNSWESLEEEE